MPKHKAAKTSKKSTEKRRFGFIYKTFAFLLLLALIIFGTFVILVSTKAKSITFVTKRIESVVKQNLGSDASVKSSSLSFTRYGSLKVTVEELRMPYTLPNSGGKDVFLIPRIETELPLLKLLLLQLRPNKIKIIEPHFTINNWSEEPSQNLTKTENSEAQVNQIPVFINLLKMIRSGEFPIRTFHIENAKITLRGKEINTEILLKKSYIKTSVRKKILTITSENLLSLGKEKSDINLAHRCDLPSNNELRCGVKLTNFIISSVADVHRELAPLHNINAALNLSASFAIKNGEFSIINFFGESKKGSFEFSDLFSRKMEFSNLSIEGNYSHKNGTINLSRINADFDDGLTTSQNNKSRELAIPHLEMSAIISGLKNQLKIQQKISPEQEIKKSEQPKTFVNGKETIKAAEANLSDSNNAANVNGGKESKSEEIATNKKIDLHITLQNVPGDKIEKFWPKNLNQSEIRDWVTSHIAGGIINKSFAKLSLTQKNEEITLEKVDAELSFVGLNLNYDEYFPPITNISGLAKFDTNSMKIFISEGKVLSSKISDSLVTIEDFSAPTTLLRISGKSQGDAADGLKHADYKSDFATEIAKYLNGNSQNQFDVSIPLTENLALKDIYISADSSVTNLDNSYLKGSSLIKVKKESGSDNFAINIDLTATKIEAKAFDVTKEANIESGLDFVVSLANPDKLGIKRILLWKKEQEIIKSVKKSKSKKSQTPEIPKTREVVSKLSGHLEFETNPFLLSLANFKNSKFGNNDYTLSYVADKKKSIQKISLKGSRLDLASFLNNKLPKISNDKKSNETQTITSSEIRLAVGQVGLLGNKSLRNFNLALNCRNDFCYSAGVRGNYSKKQFMNLKTSKKPKEKFVRIEGDITDLGYLAEGLGISNVIAGGETKIKIQTTMANKKQIFEGQIKIDNDITIYESAAVKKLAKNSLFSTVKDTIFSSEKIIFDSVKLQFKLENNLLNIESLVANNYKIGITAKGFFNLKDQTHNIKGMIVPGFIINNLFGIGKIPILGNIISGLLTGGEGGGLFGIRYEYVKKKGDKEATFETSKVSAFVPSSIGNLFY